MQRERERKRNGKILWKLARKFSYYYQRSHYGLRYGRSLTLTTMSSSGKTKQKHCSRETELQK